MTKTLTLQTARKTLGGAPTFTPEEMDRVKAAADREQRSVAMFVRLAALERARTGTPETF
jgi:hypothetical protein